MQLIGDLSPLPLEPLGIDNSLDQGEQELREAVHAFAQSRIEPACARLDRMPAAEMIAEGSEWWAMLSEAMNLGLDVDGIYLGQDRVRGNRLKGIVFEELGHGDSGFATGLMVAFFPYVMAGLLGRKDLQELCAGKVGCWIATQPSRGSDVGDVSGQIMHSGGEHPLPELTATIGERSVYLNGRSSSWVSFGPVADIALAYVPIVKDEKPIRNEDGTLAAVAVLVPLDRNGVSKGPPLDKLGQRPLPQGSIRFDNVEVPRDFVVAEPEDYRASMQAALCEGNQTLGAVFTGLARRAFEHAIAYAHERRQGGAPLIEHQMVRYRLFESFRKVQVMRATMRQTLAFNGSAADPQLYASVTAKTTVTESALDVADDCMRMFGGNGLTRAFPLEKLYRDARAAITEDGDNHILTLLAGSELCAAWQRPDRINEPYAERFRIQ